MKYQVAACDKVSLKDNVLYPTDGKIQVPENINIFESMWYFFGGFCIQFAQKEIVGRIAGTDKEQ